MEVPELVGGVPQTTDAGIPRLHKGTGWLLTPNHIVTNHHVVKAREDDKQPAESDLKLQAAATKVRFDFDFASAGGEVIGVDELEAWNAKLDYAVLRLSKAVDRLPLERVDELFEKTEKSRAVNIIQHPDGDFKQIAIRNNLVTAMTAVDVRYFTDTRRGSSGSPVFDDELRVVALDRGSTMVTNVQFQGKSVAYVNVGTQLAAIQADLKANYANLWMKITG